MNAVLDTVYEHGFANTTLAKILASGNIKQGTLQHHFPTKGDLYREALRYAVFQQFELLSETKDESTKEGRLARFDKLEEAFDNRAFIILMEFWIAARTDNELMDAIAPVHQIGVALLEQSKDQLTDDDERLRSAQIFHVLRSLSLDRMIGLAAHSDAQLRKSLRESCC